MQYVLASASPRRRELLSQVLPQFEVCPSEFGERVDSLLPPEDVARALAEGKCSDVFKKFSQATVIGCDTVVVFNGEILGKPRDADDAFNTLKRLSGNTHTVITGVCIQNKNKKLIGYDRTEVKFNNLSDEFIREYVKGGSPMDKAGSYGIQDGGLVKEFTGSYTNVVGLPVKLVKKLVDEIKEDL